VADAIQGGYAVADSDGSFCLGHGSVTWVIEGVEKQGVYWGVQEFLKKRNPNPHIGANAQAFTVPFL